MAQPLSRRSFLRGALGAGVGIVAAPALIELLAPKRTIFLPPRGGWHNRLPESLFEAIERISADMERFSGLPSYLLSTPRDVVYYPVPFPHNYGIKPS